MTNKVGRPTPDELEILDPARHEALADVLALGPSQAQERALVASTDPVASVLFALANKGEEERDLRWSDVAYTLAGQGTPPATIETLAEQARSLPPAPATLALYADAEGNLLGRERLTDTLLENRADFAAPARVVPQLSWGQGRPPYVLCVIDRAGADLEASIGGHHPAQHHTVVGSDDVIASTGPDGFSQPRQQRRAQDSWHHNAGQVAEQVAHCVADVRAQLLILSGDARAQQLMLEQLPNRPGLVVHHITGSRSQDGSQAHRPEQVRTAVLEVSEVQTRRVVAHFREHVGPAGMSVEGPDATIAALANGQVACLLVTDDPADETQVWFADEATDIFLDHDSAVLSGKPVRSGRLVDVAVRSALLSSARVRVLPPDLTDGPQRGIGAICRFTQHARPLE